MIAFEKATNLPNRLNNFVAKVAYRVLCFLFINFQWVIFNSISLKTGLRYIKHMIFSVGNELANTRALVLLEEYGIFIAVAILFSMPIVPKIKEILERKNKMARGIFGIVEAIVLMILFVGAMSFVIAGQNNPFLYGNF